MTEPQTDALRDALRDLMRDPERTEEGVIDELVDMLNEHAALAASPVAEGSRLRPGIDYAVNRPPVAQDALDLDAFKLRQSAAGSALDAHPYQDRADLIAEVERLHAARGAQDDARGRVAWIVHRAVRPYTTDQLALDELGDEEQDAWFALADEIVAAVRGAPVEDDHGELEELRTLFEIQHERSIEATALWRAEDPESRALIQPDLGALLDWLIRRGEAQDDALREALNGLVRAIDSGKLVSNFWAEIAAEVHNARQLAASTPAPPLPLSPDSDPALDAWS